MLAYVIVIFMVCFLNIGLNKTLGLHLKSGVINGDNVGILVVQDDGSTIFQRDGEYPYMAGVEVSGFQYCGAVIVHKSAVLTAAHCAHHRNASDLTVRAGTLYSEGKRESSQVRQVSHLWYHPYFEGIRYEFDIGILYLETPFDFNKYVNKIRMEYNEDYVGETLTSLGFGWTLETGGGDLNLKKADLTVIDILTCRRRKTPIKYGIAWDMMCAIGDQGLCYGDSGGPFLKHYPGHPEHDYLVGINSWVPGTCSPKGEVFFVFSTVYSNKDFLDAKIFHKTKLNKAYVTGTLADHFYNQKKSILSETHL